jgi:putative transposase
VVGVRADGTKELVAVADGYRESTESWAAPLRDAKRRGVRGLVLAVGDGALGLWAAVRDVFPETREQRCWVHGVANVINALPKSAQPAARWALAEIRDVEDRAHAAAAARAFADELGAKWPKAGLPRRTVDPPQDHKPHRVHLRRRAPADPGHQGPGSKAAGLPMAFSSSSQPKTAGGPSPEPSSTTESSSNDPTSRIRKPPRDHKQITRSTGRLLLWLGLTKCQGDCRRVARDSPPCGQESASVSASV